MTSPRPLSSEKPLPAPPPYLPVPKSRLFQDAVAPSKLPVARVLLRWGSQGGWGGCAVWCPWVDRADWSQE